jgi:flagellar hook-associated protein 2
MTTRIGGLSSGLDTESIIQSLIEAKQTPVNTLRDDMEEEEIQLAEWNELDAKISSLSLVTSQLTSYTVWNQMTATSEDEDYISATVSGLSVDADSYEIHVETLAKSHRIGSASQTSATEELNLEGDFTVGGETIAVETSDTLQSIKDKINDAAANMDEDEAVKASIIGTTLVIERVKTGDTDISITDGTNNILQSGAGGLGFFTGTVASPTATLSNVLQEASDMEATVDGVTVTSSENTNTDIIEGVTLNFSKEMSAGETMTLDLEHDTDTIKSLVTEFIQYYNDLTNFIESERTVELSSEGGDIVATGYLQGEMLLSTIETNARSILTSMDTNPNNMDQDFNTFYKIGLWFPDRTNNIEVTDESKLDDALANNFEAVEELFRAWGTDGEGEGVMRQLNDFLDGITDPINGAITLKQQNLEDDINDKSNRIYSMNQDLQDYELDLWEHFAAMEEAVSQIQSQGNYLFSALGVSS